MAKKEIKDEIKIKEVYFDFENVKAVCLSRGVLKTDNSLMKEIGYSYDGYVLLKKKAPKAVAVLFKFLKDNMLTIEDVIKEVEEK